MTYVPKTKFINDINPFTGKKMPGAPVKLNIIKESYPQNAIKRGRESAYAQAFEELMQHEPGEAAIQCENNNQAKAVSYAMTRWLRLKQMDKKLRPSVLQKDGSAKVWMLRRAKEQ